HLLDHYEQRRAWLPRRHPLPDGRLDDLVKEGLEDVGDGEVPAPVVGAGDVEDGEARAREELVDGELRRGSRLVPVEHPGLAEIPELRAEGTRRGDVVRLRVGEEPER